MNSNSEIFFPKDPFLRSLVRCIWSIHDQNTSKRFETILPKGNAEIIFNLRGNISYCNSLENKNNTFPQVAINGINYAPFQLEKNGEQLFIGIRLNICALKYLLKVSSKEVSNCVIDGTLISKELDQLWHQMFDINSFKRKSAILMAWVIKKLGQSNSINYSIPDLHSNLRLNSAQSICNQFNYTERHVRRIFNNWLGMNVESFIQYKKYLKALHLIHQENCTLTQVAYDSGYYDQSHFIREFKSYTNLTPKVYQSKKSDLPGHIYFC